MKKFLAITSAEFKATFTYPGMIFIWMIELFVAPVILLFVWITILQSNPSLQDKHQQLVNYYVLLPLIAMVVAAWPAKHLAYNIRTGQINPWLIKPFQPAMIYIGNNIASKIMKLVFILPMVMVAAIGFKLRLEVSITEFLLISFVTILGAIVNFLLNLALGLIGFWIEEVESLENLYNAIYFTLGGRVIPLFLFPQFLQPIANILPFRYIASFPLEILSHSLTVNQIIIGIIFELMWILLSLGALIKLWQNGVKRYEAFGG